MKLHRFYVAELPSKIEPLSILHVVPFSGSDQWRKVFRFVSGDRMVVFDGSGRDLVVELIGYSPRGKNTTSTSDRGVEVKVIEIRAPSHTGVSTQSRETWLVAGIVKKDTFEWIVQKATEIGVSRIIPVIAERSEKKNLSMERLQKIVIEASEQSGRVTIPKLDEPVPLTQGLEIISEKKCIAWDPTGELFGQNRDKYVNVPCIVNLVGPEGGWSQKEIALFKEKGIAIVSMGPQILRAETAVVSALSLITFS